MQFLNNETQNCFKQLHSQLDKTSVIKVWANDYKKLVVLFRLINMFEFRE